MAVGTVPRGGGLLSAQSMAAASFPRNIIRGWNSSEDLKRTATVKGNLFSPRRRFQKKDTFVLEVKRLTSPKTSKREKIGRLEFAE